MMPKIQKAQFVFAKKSQMALFQEKAVPGLSSGNAQNTDFRAFLIGIDGMSLQPRRTFPGTCDLVRKGPLRRPVSRSANANDAFFAAVDLNRIDVGQDRQHSVNVVCIERSLHEIIRHSLNVAVDDHARL